jgi:hypothetical protein
VRGPPEHPEVVGEKAGLPRSNWLSDLGWKQNNDCKDG